MKLAWVSNHKPDPIADHFAEWLRDKVIGEPQQIDLPGAPSVEQLKAWGMVWIYKYVED